MRRILVSPVEYFISNADYGKSFNLLDNLRGDDLHVDAYVSEARQRPDNPSVAVHEFGSRSRTSYYLRAFATAARELRTGGYDVYHHMNLSYRWFNPLLLLDLTDDVPVVLGPCQTGHAVYAHEFNNVVSHFVGRSVPRWATDPLYTAIDAGRDYTVDPPRTRLFYETLRNADKIIVVNDEAKELYAEHVDESKLRTIPLGVDPTEFTFSPRSETDELVAIGSLRERKGYDTLLAALASVAEDYPAVHLHIFGEGPLEAALRRHAADLGIGSNVTFHGHVSQAVIREHLASARAFVHPSRSESFSLVRLEAMASGCPVVVSDISGAREMVRDGSEGFVIPAESPDHIADAIIRILSDFELTKQLGKNARERVEAKYDWRRIGEEYVSVYEEVAR